MPPKLLEIGTLPDTRWNWWREESIAAADVQVTSGVLRRHAAGKFGDEVGVVLRVVGEGIERLHP